MISGKGHTADHKANFKGKQSWRSLGCSPHHHSSCGESLRECRFTKCSVVYLFFMLLLLKVLPIHLQCKSVFVSLIVHLIIIISGLNL